MQRIITIAILGMSYLSGCSLVLSWPDEVPPTLVPPTIVSTEPSASATNLPTTTAIVIEFSHEMDTSSVTLTGTPSFALGAPTWASSNTVVTFAPSALLTASTKYTIIVGGRDTAGKGLSGVTVFSFTTEAPPDTTPPRVESTTPSQNATGVSIDKTVAVTFDEAMDTGTVVVTLSPTFDLGEPSFSADNKTVTFDAPSAHFATSTTYTATVRGKDLAGNPLAATTFSFTTAAPAVPPTVLGTSPSNGETGVGVKSFISVMFSTSMNKKSVEGAFSISKGVTCASSAWNEEATTIICTPSALSYSTIYSVKVAAGVRDSAGNTLASDTTFSFTTAAQPDTTPPTIVAVSPSNGAQGVAPGTTITVTFSEPMNLASAQAAFAISSPAGVTGLYSWDSSNKVMTFAPSAALAYGQAVSWRVAKVATDPAGNALAADGSYGFTVLHQATKIITSSAKSDGCVSDMGFISTSSSGMVIAVDTDGQYYRGFLSFDLSLLPSALTAIDAATLYVYQYQVKGNPFALCNVVAQSVSYGPTLESADFNTAVLQRQVCPRICPVTCVCTKEDIEGTLSTSAVSGWKSMDALAKVRDDWTNQKLRGNLSQYRLKLEKESTPVSATEAVYYLTGNAADQQAYLSVTYEYP